MELPGTILIAFAFLAGCGGLLIGGILLSFRRIGPWRGLAVPFLLAGVVGWSVLGVIALRWEPDDTVPTSSR